MGSFCFLRFSWDYSFISCLPLASFGLSLFLMHTSNCLVSKTRNLVIFHYRLVYLVFLKSNWSLLHFFFTVTVRDWIVPQPRRTNKEIPERIAGPNKISVVKFSIPLYLSPISGNNNVERRNFYLINAGSETWRIKASNAVVRSTAWKAMRNCTQTLLSFWFNSFASSFALNVLRWI